MSLVPDPETSYVTGYRHGQEDRVFMPDNHYHQQAYLRGWRDGAIAQAKETKP